MSKQKKKVENTDKLIQFESMGDDEYTRLERKQQLICIIKDHKFDAQHASVCSQFFCRSQSSTLCLSLYNAWKKKWLSIKFGNDQKTGIQFEKEYGTALKSMKCVCFERIIPNYNQRLELPCPCYVDKSQLLSAYGDQLIAVFCLEYGRIDDDEDDDDDNKKDDDSQKKKQRINPIDEEDGAPPEDSILRTKFVQIPSLYFLGFIRLDSPAIMLGASIQPGIQGAHGRTIQSESIIVESDQMSFDLARLLKQKAATLDQRDDAMSESKDNVDEKCDVVIPKPNKPYPNLWVYVYYWDPPKYTQADINVMDNMDFEAELMHRLKTLVSVEREVRVGSLTKEQYQLSQLPIQSKVQRTRDRLCMHFLVSAVSLGSPKIIDWYIRAESIVLQNNLVSLKDMDDRLITLIENHFDLYDITKNGTIDMINSFESFLCSTQEKRMRTAIKYARPHIQKQINKMNESPLQDDTDENYNIKVNYGQAMFDIIKRCLDYILNNADFSDVATTDEPDESEDESQ